MPRVGPGHRYIRTQYKGGIGMTIHAEVSVPPDALALGIAFEAHPGARIELERTVPVEDGPLPYFWLSNGDGDLADIEAAIRGQEGTESLTELCETDDAVLFHAVWKPTAGGVITALRTDHCGCRKATGTSEGWDLRVRFLDNDDLVAFNQKLTEEGISVTLNRLEEFSESLEPTPLSAEQREALHLAREGGYFEVPRDCTIADLADEAGISQSAFSERLRRGMGRLVDRTDTRSPDAIR